MTDCSWEGDAHIDEDFVNYLSLQTTTGAFSSYIHLPLTTEHRTEQ